MSYMTGKAGTSLNPEAVILRKLRKIERHMKPDDVPEQKEVENHFHMDCSDIWRLVGEFFGMTLFVWIGLGSAVANGLGGNAGHLLPSFAFGIAIVILAYSFAPISGGHLNPAVTLTLVVTGHFRCLMGLLYVIAQMAGATLAAGLVFGQNPHEVCFAPGRCVDNMRLLEGTVNQRIVYGTDSRVTLGQAVLGEVVGTALLCLVVLRTAVDMHGSRQTGQFAPLVIGLSIFCAHVVLIPLTNCSINPARSFGPALVTGEWKDHWIFWVGPMSGALVAAGLHQLLLRQDASGQANSRLCPAEAPALNDRDADLRTEAMTEAAPSEPANEPWRRPSGPQD
eukprot:TRINITY_DN10688_c0_g1_i3.p1 TRINITY_DN10688_c0_g1~~TRINITY_DN10688_c0_g1_i3.p1  ORF type:complete len:373 (+),score=88.83 TRINITY_DN10688_c0_g1_i3:108-1121(+)